MRHKDEAPALYLLDTNAFSDLMRDDQATRKRLAAVRGMARIVICPIVRGEIRFGLIRLPDGKKRRAPEAKAAGLFGSVECVQLSPDAADHYAEAKLACQRTGTPLEDNDLWIAAAALALGATLVCRDSHFERIEGLSIVDWSEPASSGGVQAGAPARGMVV